MDVRNITIKGVWAICILLMSAIILLGLFVFLPKTQTDTTFIIESGDSVREIATLAKEAGHVYSELSFLLWYKGFHATEPLIAGQYILPSQLSLPEFISTLTSGDITEDYISLTFPEGSRIEAMADIIASSTPHIDTDAYKSLLERKEGYAFPETYFITDTTTAEELVAVQLATYEAKLKPLRARIADHPLTEYEIITLASIVEREANDDVSMKMVSGILQNRLAIDMPLQADASIEYALEKPLSELTPEDLKIKSPYNTYLNRGLPPTPINNAGLESIMAVLEPTESDYYYYITGRDGEFYYARTLDAHNQNIARYLR